MQFTTQVPIKKSSKPIGYNSAIVLIGSCFSDNMGEKFAYYKFQNQSNPFGVLFSPSAISTVVNRVVEQRFFTKADLVYHNQLWHCFEVHSQFSNPNVEQLLTFLNEELKNLHKFLKTTSHVFITFGTAWVYKHIEKNIRVANCHKIPQKEFEKQLLSAQEVESYILLITKNLKEINPNIEVIYTVSPVRHIKDGFIENNRSKAHLLAGIHQTDSSYFPSFEIMMDELRDYRFFKEDMLHPSEIAVEYIWQKLTQTYMDAETLKTMSTVSEIQNALAHRPFNPNSEAHRAFLATIEQKKAVLAAQNPTILF